MTTHIPVMLKEMINILKPSAGEVYIDATFGGGGYTRAILKNAECSVIAIDKDPDAERRADEVKKAYPDRFAFIKGAFGNLLSLVKRRDVDGVVFDIGVSSHQLETTERGFSFKTSGPLDMRMSQEGLSAREVINSYSESQLADIFWRYGEERYSRRIARTIANARKEKPIETTKELKELISHILPFERPGFDPATRVFQALRIFINNELEELREGLKAAEALLKEGGRLIVVTFHSLEDRIVKDFLYEKAGLRRENFSRHQPHIGSQLFAPSFNMIRKKPLTPTHEEINLNPRARSAHLRWAIRTGKLI